MCEEILDKFCSPANPRIITFKDVSSASVLIKGGVVRTPCDKSREAETYEMDMYLKKEIWQHTGCSKERGALYALLSLSPKQKLGGVISATSGNFGSALSYHAMKLNIKVALVMPKNSSHFKIKKCRQFKADVILHGKTMSEARTLAMEIARRDGMLFINGYDHPDIIAGQGTVGIEILEDMPELDAVVVPVGGGSLLAGVATAIKTLSPNTKIIGVESENCPTFSTALDNNRPICTAIKKRESILAIQKCGYNSYATAAPLVDKMLVVKEEWIALAILKLAEEEKCITEGSGAIGLAAILSGQMEEFKGRKVAVILTSGNIDAKILVRCFDRALAAEGRLIKFKCKLSDRPGGMKALYEIISELGITIREVTQERAWLNDVFRVEVTIVCETWDWDHSLILKEELKNKFESLMFPDTPMAVKNFK